MPYSGSTPSIIGHSPSNNEKKVNTDISVEIEFSTDMNPDTVDPRTVSVFYDNNTVSGSVEYDKKERKAYFNPHNPLKKDTEYTVIVRGAEDIDGNSLQSYNFSFKTLIYGSLEPPTIIKPEHQSITRRKEIIWEDVENADGYSVEISNDMNFHNVLVSKTIKRSNKFSYGNFQEGQEYFVRVMARNIFAETREESIVADNIYYYSDDKRKIELDRKYTPIEEIIEIYAYDNLGTQHDVSASIESATEGIITFSSLDFQIDHIELKFKYRVTKNNSRWSDTVSFYYEDEEVKVRDEIIKHLKQEKDVLSFIKPEETFGVETGLNEIVFEIKETVDKEDISASLTGIAMNDIPYIEEYGEGSGELEVENNKDSTKVIYKNFTRLLENNEYTFKINILGKEFKNEFLTEITPLYASIRNVKNSSIEAFIENISDKKIVSYLFDNSILADEIAESADTEVDEDNILAARNFVASKTIYQLLYSIYLSRTSAESISLGDFDIDNIDFERIKPVADNLKDDIEYWKDRLKGKSNRGHARPLHVKKDDGSYPLESRLEGLDTGEGL